MSIRGSVNALGSVVVEIEQRASHDGAAPLRDRQACGTAEHGEQQTFRESCISSRPRLTPSAMRTAISRRRRSARASKRLATLAHAMSNTIAADADQPRRDLGFAACVRTAIAEHRPGERVRLGDRERRRSSASPRAASSSSVVYALVRSAVAAWIGHARFAAREHLEPRHVVSLVPAAPSTLRTHVGAAARDRDECRDRLHVEIQ